MENNAVLYYIWYALLFNVLLASILCTHLLYSWKIITKRTHSILVICCALCLMVMLFGLFSFVLLDIFSISYTSFSSFIASLLIGCLITFFFFHLSEKREKGYFQRKIKETEDEND